MNLSKTYFHELPQAEVNQLIEDKKSVGYVLENYSQPDWCAYPNALSMTFGCWSLCDLTENGFRTKISNEYCSTCPCYNKNIKK